MHGERLFDAPMSESIFAGAYYEDVADGKAESMANMRGGSAPYRRQTYWAERISQWRMLEPGIEEDDMLVIRRKWHELTNWGGFSGENKYGGEWLNAMVYTYTITKEDCRELLWSIDNDRRERHRRTALMHQEVDRELGLPPRKPAEIAEADKPFFVKKYLVRRFLLSFFPFFSLAVPAKPS